MPFGASAESIQLFLSPVSPGTKPAVDNVTASNATGFDFDTSVEEGDGVLAQENTSYQFYVDDSVPTVSTKTVEVRATNVNRIVVTSTLAPVWVRCFIVTLYFQKQLIYMFKE